MSGVLPGREVPACRLPGSPGAGFALADLRGSWAVLYFYPRDNTPGCTRESLDFQAHRADFAQCGAVVLGVSRDSPRSHEKFREKHGLRFALLSDEEERLCRLFDVIREKTLYGRKVRGVERSTFLIDPQGVLRREWRKVKVEGHAAAVLAALEEETRA